MFLLLCIIFVSACNTTKTISAQTTNQNIELSYVTDHGIETAFTNYISENTLDNLTAVEIGDKITLDLADRWDNVYLYEYILNNKGERLFVDRETRTLISEHSISELRFEISQNNSVYLLSSTDPVYRGYVLELSSETQLVQYVFILGMKLNI